MCGDDIELITCGVVGPIPRHNATPTAALPAHLLNELQLLDTLRRLRDRIKERFPGSGLGKVADDLLKIGDETAALVDYRGRPNWPIRIAVGAVYLSSAFVDRNVGMLAVAAALVLGFAIWEWRRVVRTTKPAAA